MRVAVIGGYGKMGGWFADFFHKDYMDVVIYGRNEEKLRDAASRFRVRYESDLRKAVDEANIVMVSVSIDSFEEVIRELKPYLTPDQKVIDVTSVKVMPVDVMHRYLEGITVLGMHPVFGPGAKSARNQNFILTPTNDDERAFADEIQDHLKKRGGLVTRMTPEEHDHLMSIVLGLSHFIAIATADVLLGFEQLPLMKAIGGPTYKVLLTLAESVITEDPQLYASIQMNLPGMADMEGLFTKAAGEWADIVKNSDRQGFIERMSTIKDKLPDTDPDFGESYRDMYKMLDEK